MHMNKFGQPIKLKRKYTKQTLHRIKRSAQVADIINKANETANRDSLEHQKVEVVGLVDCTLSHLDALRERLIETKAKVPNQTTLDLDYFDLMHAMCVSLLRFDLAEN